MNIDKIISHIKAEADLENAEIIQNAVDECNRIRAEFAKTEQDEYWKYLAAGAKETEQMLEQLNGLAAQEAKKQLLATQQEMVDAAFALAAEKLRELPERKFREILKKHKLAAGSSTEALVAHFKEDLSPTVFQSLFG